MWKLIEGQSLTWRGWDDEYVVYNDLSGDTHLLGADAMDILLHLKTSPADETRLAQAMQVSDDEREVFLLTLAELGALSLIEKA
jgi:PqqD family protein of HPr-rel-A system